jgi:alkylated DNA repair protein alkB family protein 8
VQAGKQQQEEGQVSTGQQQQAAAAGGPQLTFHTAPAFQVDRSKGAVVLQRYYHLFQEQELVDLVACVPGVRLVESFYDHSNWCVVYEKAS